MKRTGLLTIIIFFSLSTSTVSASVLYTVKPGDSLWEIAAQYETTTDLLKTINGMTDGSQIMPGQSVIIPGSAYHVTTGDSLWKIARIHQTSIHALKKQNSISGNVITPGQMLHIPQSRKQPITAGAFFIPGSPVKNQQSIDYYGEYLSALGLFEYRPDESGKLSRLNGEDSISRTWKEGLIPHATITNLTKEGFDPDLAHRLLSNEKKRRALIENIAGLVDEKQYKGVIIDFESLHEKDRASFNTFVQQLSTRLHKIGGEVGAALPPMTGAYTPAHHKAYDYKTIGEAVDFVFLMTYNWHWMGGAPGAIAPIKKVDAVMNYAVTAIPKEKIFLGIAMYAYDWNTEDPEDVQAYSQQRAVDTAMEHQRPIYYDFEKGSPWFSYTDPQGDIHKVWFEDARSILAKYRLVKKYDIQGVGGWKTGLDFPQAGFLLKEEFTIKKR
ncbi:glycoside hydrolase family 18 protein [Halobacillus kuroshimensis]|uniref:Glycoside hydrolase family 18 protein n=2 Tax=Halobacillus kuroshimensis TaxID=302481 RepID=A0ABS3DX51_9BACI|nr:glycoside hydrolase family 18 protein [Halobacillus kuroshimensis]